MKVQDLGRMRYRDAWEIQRQHHEEVKAGGEETLLFVEHEPVITFGRRGNSGQHLLASEQMLAQMGVELVQSDRGGDITFHGPGQIVVYPIIRLADHQLSVGGYVHSIEAAVIATLGAFGIAARTDASAVGVWTDAPGRAGRHAGQLAKICAIGVRISRGVSLHGLALNVETDLNAFNLIVPCGLASRPVTSLRELMNEQTPTLAQTKIVLREKLLEGWTRGAPAAKVSSAV